MTVDGGPRSAMVEDRDPGERARTVFGAARERYGWVPNTVRERTAEKHLRLDAMAVSR